MSWSHLSTGDALCRARALDALADASGIFIGAAADHRDALRNELAKTGAEVSDADVAEIKARVAAAIAPAASLILLDIELGAPAAIASGALPGSTALVVPLEAAGYGDVAKVHESALMDGWSPAAARRMGAAACKLLLPFRVDVPEQAEVQAAVAARCADGLPRGRHRARARADRVPPARREDRPRPLRGAGGGGRRAARPGRSRAAEAPAPRVVRRVPAARRGGAAPGTPWVLLGGGADEDTLLRQVEEACRAGASGFIVGRTIWSDALVRARGRAGARAAGARAAAARAARRDRPGPRDAVAGAGGLAGAARRRPVSPRRLTVARPGFRAA